MKMLTDLDWVGLAASKDDSRINLSEIYRDKTCHVATDGHRLHLTNGLPEVPPHFPSGLRAEFPEYQQVIPKSTQCAVSLNAVARDELIVFLKLVNKASKLKDKMVKLIVVKEGDSSAEIVLEYLEKEAQLTVLKKIPIDNKSYRDNMLTYLNAKYLLDAITPTENTEHGTIDISLDASINHGLGNPYLGPIEIRANKNLAIVMSMKND